MIEVEKISYAYVDKEKVLRDISFKVFQGEKVVLLGTNGSGKTTLLKILDGLIFPSEGRYAYNGVAVNNRTLKDGALAGRFRKEVVFLFQNPDAMLFNPTVYDEIAFGLKQIGTDDIEEKVHYSAKMFGIERYLDRPPFKLSRGEKQKVCLASLLVLDPELLLLDEPTANLDPGSTGWLIDFLGGLDMTSIVTTHNLGLADELGERTLLLSENHELIYDGKIDALFEDRQKLMEANLLHEHRHRHGELEHKHFHYHEWD